MKTQVARKGRKGNFFAHKISMWKGVCKLGGLSHGKKE